MLTSKLTSKYQATIPKEVRSALHLEASDRIMYLIKDDNTVVITRVNPLDLEYLSSISKNLSEWNSEEDENAFRNL
jgi:AbrB family looped-hinge helix DNA binding protein